MAFFDEEKIPAKAVRNASVAVCFGCCPDIHRAKAKIVTVVLWVPHSEVIILDIEDLGDITLESSP